jgi:hypothetical protein
MRSLRLTALCLLAACGRPNPIAPADAGTPTDAGPAPTDDNVPIGGAGLPLSCAALTAPPRALNPCPAPAGGSGHVGFCFRPGWAGVTGVDVYGGFGQASDWKMPFLTLADDGTGTFVGQTAVADGTYPYMFRAHGAVDGLVKDGQYLLDPENPSFQPHVAGAPVMRSVSMVTVPQMPPAPRYHVRGRVLFGTAPQPCYSVDLEVGELSSGSKVVSEHYTANFTESAADGSFDFTSATGPIGLIVRYPFLLGGPGAPYPDPASTPSVGIARANVTVASADVALDPVDISYPDYAALMPKSGTVSLPATFTFTLIPAAQSAWLAVIATNSAGNDPLYSSAPSSATSVTWDGSFGMGNQAAAGMTYYWGTWQKRAPAGDAGVTWNEESLLFPITFQ